MIDYITLTIILVILVAFCMPFVYSHQKKKKEEKKLIDSFLSKAQDHQLKISKHELWRRNYIIGIDSDKGKVFYIKFLPEMKEKIIDLHEIKKVRVADIQREVGTDKEKVIEKLWLSFSYIDLKVPETDLEFYDADESMGLMGEPLLIKRWEKIIQDNLDVLHRHMPSKNIVIKA
jgi:hypothetical protein